MQRDMLGDGGTQNEIKIEDNEDDRIEIAQKSSKLCGLEGK